MGSDWIGVGGTILGAIVGSVITVIAGHLQDKRAAKDKKNQLTNEIIGETLRFLFRISDIANSLWADRELFERLKGQSAEKAKEQKQKMYERFHESIDKDYFDQLNFHSFQLKRLGDKLLWQDFESLMTKYREVTEMVLHNVPKEQYQPVDKNFQEMKRAFIDKCISLTKI